MEQLVQFFTEGITQEDMGLVGTEIETQFITDESCVSQTYKPITPHQSQGIFWYLVEKLGWCIADRKNMLITELRDSVGNAIRYELGRHNIEIATIPHKREHLMRHVDGLLNQLRTAAWKGVRAIPWHKPILSTSEDLLVVPDERDEIWVQLDGRNVLLSLFKPDSVS
ncbi:MAG: hypothetical protein QF747_02085 [Patescibacteria group bacterium]|nr:hypothetical protein [Patescibacteria group bacterium]|tara:strand:+ start:2843 stop:3346 length:504 start_codon:yes stop_codon:yes gene_type:complete